MANDDWLSDFFLGHEGRQQRDIRALQSRVASINSRPGVDPDAFVTLQRRVDRLELMCSALLEIIHKRSLATPEEVAVVIAQIDLRDGLEDGAIQSSRRRNARLCAACRHPVNPARSSCVYCEAPVTAPPEASKPPPPPPRTVTCAKCQKVVDERETFFSGSGLRCGPCFHEA